jgi:hypothetical protein
MRVHQITGSFGKSSIIPHVGTDDGENRTRKNRIKALREFIKIKNPGEGLVITYQALETEFKGLPGIDVAHFNAIAGLDRYKNVSSLFVIGHAMPSAEETRRLAIALTGRAIHAQEGQWETRAALMADGSGKAIRVIEYADKGMEMVRKAIADQKLQEIGRGRGVMRTEANPLDVYVFANTVLPLPLESLSPWVDARPNVVEIMLSRQGALLSPVDAVKVYPDLFSTADAARMAIKRCLASTTEQTPIEESLRSLFGCGIVKYQVPGERKKPRTALTRLSSSDFRVWLEGIVGNLSQFSAAFHE